MHKKLIKPAAIGIIAVVLTAAGIKASDSILSRESGNGQCPDDMVLVLSPEGSFCIDKYEASAGDECPVSDPANQVDTRDNISWRNCVPFSREDRKPWRFVSQSQAAVLCAKAGKRLPDNEEWYLASLATPDKQDGWGGEDCQVDNNWDSQPGLTGSGENCVSAAGAFDMIGNVWEWVGSEIEEGRYQGRQLPESGYITAVDAEGMPVSSSLNLPDLNYNQDYHWLKDKGLKAVARGGYWANRSDAGIYATYLVAEPSYIGAGIGFRCVK